MYKRQPQGGKTSYPALGRINPLHTMLRTGTDAYSGVLDKRGIRAADDMVVMPLQCGTCLLYTSNSTLAPVEVSTSAHASTENAQRLDAGDIDFGFMAANWIGRARDGDAPFAKAIDLRMVAPMNAGPLFFIARADSRLQTVADLRGARLAVGPERSGMAQHARVMLAALGLSFADITPLYLDFAAGADAIASGAADAQLQCPIPNTVMTALADRALLRVLPYACLLYTSRCV